jgi:hypothetical protein
MKGRSGVALTQFSSSSSSIVWLNLQGSTTLFVCHKTGLFGHQAGVPPDV